MLKTYLVVDLWSVIGFQYHVWSFLWQEKFVLYLMFIDEFFIERLMIS